MLVGRTPNLLEPDPLIEKMKLTNPIDRKIGFAPGG
jgi:hypothetical protein